MPGAKRRLRRLAAWLGSAGWLVSCSAAPPPAPTAEPAARRPPGVSTEPSLELPTAVPASLPADELVVLAEPLDPRPALEVVHAFFAAIVRESGDDLERLLDRGAHSRASARARPEAALPWWRRRFERLDYASLAADVVYRPSEVELHTGRDAAALADARQLPVVPKDQEVLVRVPIVAARAASLFGGEVYLLLRPGRGSGSGEGYKIGELFEDFRLP